VEVVTGNGTGIVAHLGATLDGTTTTDPRGEIETCSMIEEVAGVVEDEVEEEGIESEAETVMNSQPNKDEAARRVQPRLLRRRSLRLI
jgi:hypothetical protein